MSLRSAPGEGEAVKDGWLEATQEHLQPPEYLIEAINGFLMTSYQLSRPAPVTSWLIATLVKMAEDNRLFPARKVMTAAFGAYYNCPPCSVFSIDAALGVGLVREFFTEETIIRRSKKQNSSRPIRRRRFVPTKLLLDGIDTHSRRPLQRRA